MTYFTSDLHFGHGKAMEFDPCFRRFSSVDEMDSHLINLWNSRVTPCDTVYNIGDLSFHKDMSKNLSILQRLNGKHILILGNHDAFFTKHKNELLSMQKLDGNMLFDEICEYKDMPVEYNGEKYRVILFHYPMAEWNAGHRGSILLYGHLHSNLAPIKGRALNVGYDLHGKILDLGEVLEFVRDIKPFEHSKSRMFSQNDGVESRSANIKTMIKRLNKK